MYRWFFILAATGLAPAQSLAQTQGGAASERGEIIVTGERIDRSLAQTASSVSVTSAETLDSLAGADRLDRLLELLPNVQLGSGGEGPTIRGQDTTGPMRDLPAFLGGTRPRLALQVDGRTAGFTEFVFGVAPLWDIERIEVFRSPQTTAQGRNAIAGSIVVASKDPTFAWEGAVRAMAGDDALRQGSAMVSGPIAGDRLAFRIAADYRRSHVPADIDGPIVGADPNIDRYGMVRAKLLWVPPTAMAARAEFTYTHSESLSPQVVGIVPPYRERRNPFATYGVFRTNVDALTGELQLDPHPAVKTKTTISAGDGSFRRHALRGLGEALTDASDFSFESVVTWRPGEEASVLGGVHYLRNRLTQTIDLSVLLGTGEFRDRQPSLGLFAEASARLSPRWFATAGIRYQRDGQTRAGALERPGLRYALDYDRTFTAWLPKVSIAYEFPDGPTAGVLVQRAYNPGGTNIDLATGAPNNFAAEGLWNFELFARGKFDNGRGTITTNLFYNDFSNAQRAQQRSIAVPGGVTIFFADIVNVPSARSHGLDLEMGWQASRRLSLRAGLGLLDTRIGRTTDPADPLRHRKFQRSPEWTGSLAVDWQPADDFKLAAQLRHNAGYFSDDANSPQLAVKAATVADARADYSLGPVRIFAYARNLFDRFYLTYRFSSDLATAGDPRQFGAGIEARF